MFDINVVPIDDSSVTDAFVRRRALDVGSSFIVQAPAGSGKTSLLVQRFLALLARVESVPEEVLAITFTKKAAAEMAERIVGALKVAVDSNEPTNLHERVTWRLAKAVLIRNEQENWHLLEDIKRLRIMTFDGFCSYLVGQMPVVSQFGVSPSICEDPKRLYRQAVHQLFNDWQSDEGKYAILFDLLMQFDNRAARLESLLVAMLARRDQWLGAVYSQHVREVLEDTLSCINYESICDVESVLHNIDKEALFELISFAASNIEDASHFLFCWRDVERWPDVDIEHKNLWLGLVQFLLKKDGDVRKRVDKSLGFLAVSAAKSVEEKETFKVMKARMLDLLEDVEKSPQLVQALQALSCSPAPTYTEQQWRLLNQLREVLIGLVVYLKREFQLCGQVDFVEVAQGALRALGDIDAPSELALRLDYQINHVLVDEFQDTSHGQVALLRQLISGWQQDDGRTLFVVGDPMQSIYRFRQAEVGLFLETQQKGLGQLALEPLLLSVNFRSCAELIRWNNEAFKAVFPKCEDINSGAVVFSPSDSVGKDSGESAVFCHPCISGQHEAMVVAERVQDYLKHSSDIDVAILVRARGDLLDILQALRTFNIVPNAVEIDGLADKGVVQDLWALTRALINPVDRVAWLAVLRAPWCGLTLKELTQLCELAGDASLLDGGEAYLAQLDTQCATFERLSRCLRIFRHFVNERARYSLRYWVESCWIHLGGPHLLKDETSLSHAEDFLALLDGYGFGDVAMCERLVEQVKHLFARASAQAESRLHVMTIHKSKGLEFDVVFVPGLFGSGQADEKSILGWLLRENAQGETQLLLAPLNTQIEGDDTIYQYYQKQNQLKSEYERGRLLYVALTRAKQFLHLSGVVAKKENAFVKPSQRSLGIGLWSYFEESLALSQVDFSLTDEIAQNACFELERILLPGERLLEVELGHDLSLRNTLSDSDKTIDFEREHKRLVGTFVHRLLCQLSRVSPTDLCNVSQISLSWRNALLTMGMLPRLIDYAVEVATQAIERVLADEKGRWILWGPHKEACSEQALSVKSDGKIEHLVIDRSFVSCDNERWIVDYKIVEHDTQHGLDNFIDVQIEKYRQQLVCYGHAYQQLYCDSTIRLAIYFPLQSVWREISDWH